MLPSYGRINLSFFTAGHFIVKRGVRCGPKSLNMFNIITVCFSRPWWKPNPEFDELRDKYQ